MKERIEQFVRDQVKDEGVDPVYVVGDLLRRMIVKQADWTVTAQSRKLQIGYTPNPHLPDVPDNVIELFLLLADGQPAGYAPADTTSTALVEWWPERKRMQWVWRFHLDDRDVAETLPIAGILLSELPGRLSANFRLLSGENETPFNIHLEAVDDRLQITGQLGEARFESTCERKDYALLEAIEQMHKSCKDESNLAIN